MALFNPGVSKCSICHKVLNDNDDRIGTSAFIRDETDKLWPYSDSNMHKKCFIEWELKEEFIKRFNEAQSFHTMTKDGALQKRRS